MHVRLPDIQLDISLGQLTLVDGCVLSLMRLARVAQCRQTQEEAHDRHSRHGAATLSLVQG